MMPQIDGLCECVIESSPVQLNVVLLTPGLTAQRSSKIAPRFSKSKNSNVFNVFST